MLFRSTAFFPLFFQDWPLDLQTERFIAIMIFMRKYLFCHWYWKMGVESHLVTLKGIAPDWETQHYIDYEKEKWGDVFPMDSAEKTF